MVFIYASWILVGVDLSGSLPSSILVELPDDGSLLPILSISRENFTFSISLNFDQTAHDVEVPPLIHVLFLNSTVSGKDRGNILRGPAVDKHFVSWFDLIRKDRGNNLRNLSASLPSHALATSSSIHSGHQFEGRRPRDSGEIKPSSSPSPSSHFTITGSSRKISPSQPSHSSNTRGSFGFLCVCAKTSPIEMTSKLDKGKRVAVDSVPLSSKSSSNAKEAAEKYEKVFDRLGLHDAQNIREFCLSEQKTCPSSIDWEYARCFIKFLKIFHDATLTFSGSLYVASNTFLHQLCLIHTQLQAWRDGKDLFLKIMAENMKTKYDKYWGNYETINPYLFVSILLDPRHKERFLRYCFVVLFGEFKASELVVKVRNNLHSLYEEYKLLYGDDVEVMNDVNNEKELEVDTEVDDILVMHVSIVAYESAFSTCGRVLDLHRCSLSTRMVEALICTQNWLRLTPINLDEAIDEIEHIETEILGADKNIFDEA
ncbi:hypothetical protein WN943_013944 [Citrus x changshan-huyou]